MKRSTCKVLIWIGSIWLIILLIFLSIMGIMFNVMFNNIPQGARPPIPIPKTLMGVGFFMGFLIYGLPGIILIIIGRVKWNSETEFKSMRQRAKVNVEVKGKMKDLK